MAEDSRSPGAHRDVTARQDASTARDQHAVETGNAISGGRFDGPVFQGGDIHVVIPSAVPDDDFDADAFARLSPSVSARRLRRQPHDKAVDVLAEAAIRDPGHSAEVLGKLLPSQNGDDLVTALLADISRSSARQLVALMAAAAPWLAYLPDAADAIEECERKERVKRTGSDGLGESRGALVRATARNSLTQGFCQRFENGLIHWSLRAGAQVTRGARARYFDDMGGTGGPLGFPLTPPASASTSPPPFGTEGSLQRFEGEDDYPAEICKRIGSCGATVYWSRKHGPHATGGSIGAHFEREGGTGAWLGFPVSDQEEVGPSHRKAGAGTTGWRQRFEGGVLYYSTRTRAAAVPSHIADYHETRQGVASARGFPIGSVLKGLKSQYGTTGQCQRFEGDDDYPEDVLKQWALRAQLARSAIAWLSLFGDYPEEILQQWKAGKGPGRATVYTSKHGTYSVGWGNGVIYERLGATASWLGFPTSEEEDARMPPDEQWCTIQTFEGGAIFFKKGPGSVTVNRAVMDYLTRSGLRQRIGFPLQREDPLAGEEDEEDEPVQFFEHGVVTRRNGVIEAWLRPDEPVPSD